MTKLKERYQYLTDNLRGFDKGAIYTVVEHKFNLIALESDVKEINYVDGKQLKRNFRRVL